MPTMMQQIKVTPIKLEKADLVEVGQHRISSLSVSWSAASNGSSYLAMASSDRVARVWAIEESSAREVLVVSGHQGAVTKVRFHPKEASQLCTAAVDQKVCLWDIRQATQRSTGKIDLLSGKKPITLEWGLHSNLLLLTEEDGTIYVYDTRKLAGGRSSAVLKSFAIKPFLAETCQFSPDGDYLVAGSTLNREGMSEIRLLPLKGEDNEESDQRQYTFPAHTGPLYASQFSPDGKRFALGGSDSIVSLWDVPTMCCTHTVTRCTKFIRSVGFSYDGKLLGIASEDDGIDVSDASDGCFIGNVGLGSRPKSGGAEEIAWHPSEYIVACARIAGNMGLPNSPVTIAKLSLTISQ